METCIECGASAERQPYVGLRGDRTSGAICAECQADPTHRKTPQKVHYFERDAFDRQQGMHGVNQGPPPAGKPNSTRFEIEGYYGDVDPRASVVEEAVRTAAPDATIESARAYRNEVDKRTRVHLLGEVRNKTLSPDDVKALAAKALVGADRVDVQTWPVYR